MKAKLMNKKLAWFLALTIFLPFMILIGLSLVSLGIFLEIAES